MSNALNVRPINNVTTIAQGDNASTVILELLDNHRLVMPFLNGATALINFINNRNEIQYQTTTPIFDSRIEFNIDAVIPAGKYNVEVRVEVEDASYVFPSSVNYRLTINKSANDFYNIAIDVNGLEVVINEVYQRLESENTGLIGHVTRRDNPHQVTKDQVGLENVDDVQQAPKADFDNHVGNSDVHVTSGDKNNWNSKATQEDIDNALNNLDAVSQNTLTNHTTNSDLHFEDGEKAQMKTDIDDKIEEPELRAHTDDKGNPHNVTKEQVGLSNVTNDEQATKAEFNELKEVVEGINGSIDEIPLELVLVNREFYFIGEPIAFVKNNMIYIDAVVGTPENGSVASPLFRINGTPEGKIVRRSVFLSYKLTDYSPLALMVYPPSVTNNTPMVDLANPAGKENNQGYDISTYIPLEDA